MYGADKIQGAFAGKGSPSQIQGEASKILGASGQVIGSAEQARQLIHDKGLGIDCSGFVYHVLDQLLQDQFDTRLASQLFVPKSAILENIDRESWMKQGKLTDREQDELADFVPMDFVEKRFDKQANHLTNVQRLISPQSSIKVLTNDLRAGDMIYTNNGVTDHIRLVYGVKNDMISVVESKYDSESPGGITHTEAPINLYTDYYRLKILDK